MAVASTGHFAKGQRAENFPTNRHLSTEFAAATEDAVSLAVGGSLMRFTAGPGIWAPPVKSNNPEASIPSS
jgi:hypothetical protein